MPRELVQAPVISPWIYRALWLALSVLVVCLTYARVSSVHLEDDNLYLNYEAQSVSPAAEALEQRLIRDLEASPDCKPEAFRFSLRRRYAGNYDGYLAVQGLLQKAATSIGFTGFDDILCAMLSVKSLFLWGLSSLLLFAAGKDRSLWLAVACAFVILAGTDIVAHRFTTFWIVDIEQPLKAVEQVVYSWVLPHQAHSYFGVTPRNAALLLFAAAMVLKWRGAWVWASLALLSMALVHQTYAGLGLFFFCAAACVSRPELFSKASVRLVLSAAAVVYLMREHYFAGQSGLARIVWSAGIFTVAYPGLRLVSGPAFTKIRRRLLCRFADREVTLDVAALLASVSAITLACLIGGQLTADPLTRQYFWADFATRIWSFVRFPVVVAIVLFLFSRSALQLERWAPIGLTVACVGLSALALSQGDTRVWQRLSNEMREQLEATPDLTTLHPRDEEARIYAHLTMVAASREDASTADAAVIGERRIRCERANLS